MKRCVLFFSALFVLSPAMPAHGAVMIIESKVAEVRSEHPRHHGKQTTNRVEVTDDGRALEPAPRPAPNAARKTIPANPFEVYVQKLLEAISAK